MAGDGVKTSWQDKIRRRAVEPSTWAGISLLATLAGVNPQIVEAIVAVSQGTATKGGATVGLIGAIAAILLPERGAHPPRGKG